MNRAPALLTLLVALVLAACATSPPERFYALHAPAGTGGSSSAAVEPAAAVRIAIAAVTVPELVDRTEMVFQGDEGHVVVSEENRWAEPLSVGIGRVVASNLSARLTNSVVVPYPEQMMGQTAIQVRIDIQDWRVERSNAVHVTALWQVSRLQAPGHPEALSEEGRSVIDVPGSAGGIDAALAAENQALVTLSDALAAAVRRVGKR